MKLRLAHAREPTREMNRPKPGTAMAAMAISSTRPVLTAAKMRLFDLAPNFALKLACKQQIWEFSNVHTGITIYSTNGMYTF